MGRVLGEPGPEEEEHAGGAEVGVGGDGDGGGEEGGEGRGERGEDGSEVGGDGPGDEEEAEGGEDVALVDGGAALLRGLGVEEFAEDVGALPGGGGGRGGDEPEGGAEGGVDGGGLDEGVEFVEHPGAGVRGEPGLHRGEVSESEERDEVELAGVDPEDVRAEEALEGAHLGLHAAAPVAELVDRAPAHAVLRGDRESAVARFVLR
mmetsp:Transcript_17732/g.55543  ORF Transcript_17732/g.55543 Transcript_17732/m.55543 type:complete len:206 (+) Transcript_17732:386-1003(+)